jgi:hypothetical protein
MLMWTVVVMGSEPLQCSAESCPNIQPVHQGSVLDHDLQNLKYVHASYNSSNPVPDESLLVRCARVATFEKIPSIPGDAYKKIFSYINVTSNEPGSYEYNFIVNPEDPADYLGVDDQGNRLPHFSMKVIYYQDGFVVVIRCVPGADGSHQKCDRTWRLFGHREVITPEEWTAIRNKLVQFGLPEAETIQLISQNKCAQN